MDDARLSELFGALVAEPEKAGLFTDFDGTLSPIVDVPADARPIGDAPDVLGELASTFGQVAVLSGRQVDFLEEFFPASVTISGLYGLERLEGGERHDHPQGGSWREVAADIAKLGSDRLPADVRVENKGLSVTLHFRGHSELDHEVKEFAVQQAARSGLVCRPARMSYELHPPVEADKGTALADLVDGLRAACFIGDDHGDLTAFDALDALGADGLRTVKVAVASGEAPSELIDRADLVVSGPQGALDLLHWLLERTS